MGESGIYQVEVTNQLTSNDLLTVTDHFAHEILTNGGSFALVKSLTYGDMLLASLITILIVLTIAKMIMDIIK